MDITINARHKEVADSTRQYVDGKVAKLPRYYDNVQSIEVVLDHQGDDSVVEIIAHGIHKHTFVATHRDQNLYACFDMCLDKITQQLRRHKDKVRDRQGPPHSEQMPSV